MLALYLVAASGIAADSAAAPLRIDLTVPTPCPEAEQRLETELVVCARTEDAVRHRLDRDTKGKGGGGIPPALVELKPGTTLSAETESADLGMARAQRLMVRLKVKF